MVKFDLPLRKDMLLEILRYELECALDHVKKYEENLDKEDYAYMKEPDFPDRILEGDLFRWLIFPSSENIEDIIHMIRKHMTSDDFKTPIFRFLFKYFIKHEKCEPKDIRNFFIDLKKNCRFIEHLFSKKIDTSKARMIIMETIKKILNRSHHDKVENIRNLIQSGTLPDSEMIELSHKFNYLKFNYPNQVNWEYAPK